jgi:hypothetical protein
MTELSYTWDQDLAPAQTASAAAPWVEPPRRSIWQPICMFLPVLCAAAGYFAAAPFMVDLSFILLTIFCTAFLIADLSRFSERYGVGGIVLFGGVLIWFCYDYFYNWFLGWTPSWNRPMPPDVIAKSAACHMLYIMCMSVGIRIRYGRWFSRLVNRLPETYSPSNYFWVVLMTQIVGLAPFFLFTREPFYLSALHGITGGRGGLGTQWTVGRTGNVNFSYGAYVAQMLEVGTGGAVVAAFCIVFLRQNIFRNIICALIYLFWLAEGFGTGTRGEMVVLILPAVCFVFIRYHVQAQELLHRFSIRAYMLVFMLLAVSILLIQIQIRFRNSGFSNIKLSEVSLTKIQGNMMFSEGLIGFSFIPEHHDFFYNKFPGQMYVMPIPNFLFWAAVAPMPRALWTSKPIDPSWKWYNAAATGRSTAGGGAIEGTTVAEGIVGYWFFRFGIPGVIEGGLLMGWLLGIMERALFNNGGRPFAFLACLALLTWMFRTYRDADLQDLADTLVVLGGLAILILLVRPFLGQRP